MQALKQNEKMKLGDGFVHWTLGNGTDHLNINLHFEGPITPQQKQDFLKGVLSVQYPEPIKVERIEPISITFSPEK